jgi:hypothetical protein
MKHRETQKGLMRLRKRKRHTRTGEVATQGIAELTKLYARHSSRISHN